MKRELRTCDQCGNEWDGGGYALQKAVTLGSAPVVDLCSLGCLEQWAKDVRSQAEAWWQRQVAKVTEPE